MTEHILWTGLAECFDSDGKTVPCRGSGQDGEYLSGYPWPEPRFVMENDALVLDRATGLYWMIDGNLFSYPMSWQEGLEQVERLNEAKKCNRSDWRLPNRREMRSLISHGARKPALPQDHPFKNVFLGWYWTSTTSARSPGYAWYVHMEGGRMFYGRKDSYYLIWPVCGESGMLPRTGQNKCYDEQGGEISCDADDVYGQDGVLQHGVAWPLPRFRHMKEGIADDLTGLIWHHSADLEKLSTWNEALAAVRRRALQSQLPWRLPSINELESLVDASSHSPALSAGHPFSGVREAYWSSTTSYFEPDWAYVLYLHKGAVGVGFKKNRDFSLWPVMEKAAV